MGRTIRRRAACATAIFAAGGWAAGQGAPPPAPGAPNPVRVEDAIDRGAAYLMNLFRSGQIPPVDTAGGSTKQELMFYTLLHAGISPDDATMRKVLDGLLAKDLQKTYCVALLAMGLNKLDPETHQARIAQCAQFLVDNQCTNGQWSYGEPVKLEKLTPTPSPRRKDVFTRTSRPETAAVNESDAPSPAAPPPPKRDKPAATRALKPVLIRQRSHGPASGDNSNTQYAALGLRACLESGIVLDKKILELAHDWWKQAQHGSGGWNYTLESNGPAYGSMTAGGVGSTCIYRYYLGRPFKGEKKVEEGVRWLGSNFVVDRNPKVEGPFIVHSAPYYWLYGLERVGALYGTTVLGGHDWYNEGAAWLLAQQTPDGSWGPGNIENTCWAILFLRRATKPLKRVNTQ